MVDLEELEQLALRATPGPWNAYKYVDHDGPPSCDDIGVQAISKKNSMYLEVLCKMDWYEGSATGFERADAEAAAAYIAAANPATILALIAEVRALREIPSDDAVLCALVAWFDVNHPDQEDFRARMRKAIVAARGAK